MRSAICVDEVDASIILMVYVGSEERGSGDGRSIFHPLVGYGPLRIPEEGVSDVIRSDNRSDKRRSSAESSDGGDEIALLRLQLDMIEDERKREREQFEEQIGNYQETHKNAQEHQTRLTALLTDQRSEKERTENDKVAPTSLVIGAAAKTA